MVLAGAGMNDISRRERVPAVSRERQRRPRRKVLTDAMVAALPRRRQPYFHPDPELPKHGVRVRPTGPGTYTVVTRDPFKKQRWVKIGNTAGLKIAEARELARPVIRRIEQGLPAFEPPPPRADSVATVLGDWLKRHAYKNGLRRAAEYERIVAKYILPHWHNRAFVALKRSDAATLLDYVEDNHGPHQADAVLAILRTAANWLRDREDSYAPPFGGIRSRVAIQNRKRSRILNDAEIRAVWQAADSAGSYGALVKLLLVCGQRLDKVRTMRWSDIAPDGTWTIRTETREKGNAGSLKLPKLALDVIEAQPRLASNDHIFAGHRGAQFFKWDRKDALDKTSGVTGWRIHDLRRTSRSLLSRAGVRPDIAEKVLGHAAGNIESIYDRHSYSEEKAAALRGLAVLIERIVHGPPGGNEVELHEAATS
jgi:integrase